MRVRLIEREDIKVGLMTVWKEDYNSCEYSEDSYRRIIKIDPKKDQALFDNGLWSFFECVIHDSYMVIEDKPTGIPTFDGDISLDKEEIYRVLNDPRMRHFNGLRIDEVECQNQYQEGKDLPQGTKLDGGKLKPTLLLDDMPLAIQEILKVLQFGAEKYSEGNWLKVPNGINRYRNAADRHRLAIDELDDESGMMHLAHEATSVLMLLELKLREKKDAE